MGISDEIAGALPAFYVICRVAPSRAGIVALALQELEICGRAEQWKSRGQLFDVLELLMDVVASHEDLAIIDSRIPIGRRNRVSIHVELRQVLEHLFYFVHVGLFVDRGVGTNLEAGLLGGLDSLNG